MFPGKKLLIYLAETETVQSFDWGYYKFHF